MTVADHDPPLPEPDSSFVNNLQDSSQCILLTETIEPVLNRHHRDSTYYIGQNCGIHWRWSEPPEAVISPGWFYVPNVLPNLNGLQRQTYVLWQELVAPWLVLEFVVGDGRAERDPTPFVGKYWIYEQAIRVPFYGIYDPTHSDLEMYHLIEGCYEPLPINNRGHYPITQLGVELGLWHGWYQQAELPWLRYVDLPWLRWWDQDGILLPTREERAEQERQKQELTQHQMERERQRAEQAEALLAQERQRAQRLAEQLQALGIRPDAV
ncbi:Uma2 family endonuclease [Leptolyngbya sp. FACHB-261]|uniref:Uma2 family endonuclease n=1 Tax=Leptolyngbya sp. FACHB-261 TaxID=2692806 RepID=UPI001687F861|nr:Uma2 family endonuclease [Leptolyngbya sp. FACHB-261]MBD2100594.1 Uma2 family endonuclease [Leptolyngbya sp. FACHB-261]